MRRRNPSPRPSKAARDAYCRLMRGDDDFSRLEKDSIDLNTLPQLDLDPPEVDLSHNTGEEPTP